MDALKNLTGGGGNNNNRNPPTEKVKNESSGGFMDSINSALGGGKKSEQKEDALDKGVDWVQENVLGQGPQDNESAFEQAKDEQISDFIRGQYKSTTGKELPVKDK